MAPYATAYQSYDPGKVNADLYSGFQSQFGRQPNQQDMDAFSSANPINWSQPIGQPTYDAAMSWLKAYQPGGASQAAPSAPTPGIDPGKATSTLYSQFQTQFNRQPGQADLDAFNAANPIDWTQPIAQPAYDAASAWLQAYQPTAAAGPASGAIDPGQANAQVYARFREKFGREPTPQEIEAFKAANPIDWANPIPQAGLTTALAWIDAYQPQAPGPPQGGPQGGPPTTPAPEVELGRVDPPTPFVPRTFQAPTMADALNDPGYQFARNEAVNATLNDASSVGLSRSPQAREAIAKRIGDMAQQRYSDVYNRAFDEHTAGLSAEERAYAVNAGIPIAYTGFNNDATLGEFEPQFLSWDRGQDRDWQKYIRSQDVGYRDRAFDAGEYWRRYDADWEKDLAHQANLRFMAQLGLA